MQFLNNLVDNSSTCESYLHKKLSDFANAGAPHFAHFALLVFESEEKPTRP